MKSPMIEQAEWIIDKDRYSELQVLHSGGGFYIGTIYHGVDLDEPGSRDSFDYFPTRAAAESHLLAIIAGQAPTRMTP